MSISIISITKKAVMYRMLVVNYCDPITYRKSDVYTLSLKLKQPFGCFFILYNALNRKNELKPD